MTLLIKALCFALLFPLFFLSIADQSFAQQTAPKQATAEGCQSDENDKNRPHDRVALEGVKVGRILWDVTIADPVVLAGRLSVIIDTYRDMVRQGVTPEMILAFRGGSVRLLVRDLTKLPEDMRDKARDVHDRLQRLLDLPGVRLEACYIAMRRVPLEPENLMKGIVTVNNTFLSAMGYGQKGYIALPIH